MNLSRHIIVLFIILIPFTLKSQDLSVKDESLLQEEYGKIIIYRPKNFQGSIVNLKIDVNDSLIIKIRNNSYYELNCKEGDYNFIFQKYKKSNLKLNVEGGKTYYLRLGLVIGFWSSFPEIIIVDSTSAIQEMNRDKIEKLTSNNEILNRPKNRISANFLMSVGFGGWQAFSSSEGDKSFIRFGSGFGYEFLYGREINKRLDISLGFSHQSTSLTPKVKNADITFKRNSLSITPSYIMHIQDGDFQRIKFGIGADYTFPSILVINTANYPNGFIDRWNYDAAYGFHISLIYEINFSKYFSMQYGIKYNNIKYQFIKGNQYYPIVDELKHPDGSGIEMKLGINIHFN